ncbi:MAG: nucleotidyltransferase domain-containing protein [Candidatus Bathyarchaeia archaeon]
MRTVIKDRDALISKEKIIFRVLGYTHPLNGFVCDAEYAPSNIFISKNPKALRENFQKEKYFKFYEHEGILFIKKNFPEYQVSLPYLKDKVIGLKKNQIIQVKFPEEKLKTVFYSENNDELMNALHKVLSEILDRSKLSLSDFGVFGSILHDFYHPSYSDLDFIIYGRKQLLELKEVLKEIYAEKRFMANEFEILPFKDEWKFKNFSLKEFFEHQKRKFIYGVLIDKNFNRKIKVEFEPVKSDEETLTSFFTPLKIKKLGWTSIKGEIIDESESFFMPSIYMVEAEEIKGVKVPHVDFIVSYVEEFRMQAEKNDKIYAEGNLELVESLNGKKFYQIVLTYGEKYYEQTLKKL